jgi:DNA polymerase-3 subunit epsilon
LNSASDRQSAIVRAYTEIVRGPVYLDTETTGIEASDEILEICILDADGSVRFESLVKPRGSISEEAYWVHRITKRMVKDAATWDQVVPHVTAALAGKRVAVYNAAFDLRMLRQSNARYGLPWELDERAFFCVMKLYARFWCQWDEGRQDYRWQGLGRAARQCGIKHGKTHRAQEDARVARALLQYMASYFVPPPVSVPVLPRRSRMQHWLAWLRGK